jgi:hypothetical protein
MSLATNHSDHLKYDVRVIGCPKCNVKPKEDYRCEWTPDRQAELDKVLANCPVLNRNPLPWTVGKKEEGA